MTDTYVTAKIHEALKATSGDKHDTQKLVIAWAMRDQALLLGLVKTSLKDVAADRIDDEVRRLKKTGHLGSGVLSKEDVDALVIEHTKSEKRKAIKVPPPKSSARQASVMHQLADAFKRKK